MSLKPHPEYKDSGANWLGAVPTSWSISPLGHFFTERSQTVSDKDFQPLSVTMQGIVPQMENVAKTENGDNRKLVRRGDFVINSRSDRKGSSGVADRDGSVSVISIVLEPHDIVPQFVHHLLRSKPFQEEFYRFGTGIVADLWSTRFSSMKSIRLAVPSVIEQHAIARYLDRETSEIDAFIAGQEELVVLLNERRAATITQAVTKGLDLNAPMKDSGVEWVGDVPTHWTVAAVRNAYLVLDCKHVTADYLDNGDFPLASIREVKSKYVDLRDARRTTKEFYELLIGDGRKPIAGDLIISRNASVGQVAMVAAGTEDFSMGQDVSLIRALNENQNPGFLQYALQGDPGVVGMALAMIGSTFKRINVADIKSLSIAFPGPIEQQAIVHFLDCDIGEIDATIADAREAIALSKERRAALISAAVTGKIDVRHAVPAGHYMLEGEPVVH